EVEVRAPIAPSGSEGTVTAALEQEELDLGAHAIVEAEPPRILHRTAKHTAGVARVGLTVRGRRPADQPCGPLLSPGQDLERGRVGNEVHVGLGGAGERV